MTSMMPRSFLVATFRDLVTDLNVFAVNVHLPMKETDKWLALKTLEEVIVKPGRAIIAAGDWNFFDDLEGKQMRDRMYETFEDDVAYPLYSVEESGSYEMSGTFIGFDHDTFHADMTPDKTGNRYTKMCRLDHVFVRGFKRGSSGNPSVDDGALALMPSNASTIDRKTYPTDHCAIHCILEWKLQ